MFNFKSNIVSDYIRCKVICNDVTYYTIISEAKFDDGDTNIIFHGTKTNNFSLYNFQFGKSDNINKLTIKILSYESYEKILFEFDIYLKYQFQQSNIKYDYDENILSVCI